MSDAEQNAVRYLRDILETIIENRANSIDEHEIQMARDALARAAAAFSDGE